jgi:hypothetical protein
VDLWGQRPFELWTRRLAARISPAAVRSDAGRTSTTDGLLRTVIPQRVGRRGGEIGEPRTDSAISPLCTQLDSTRKDLRR